MFCSIFNPVKLLFLQITVKKHLKNMQENILTKIQKNVKKHWNFLFSYSFDLSAPRFEPLTSWLGVWHSPTVPRSITYLYFDICYLYKNIYTAKHEAVKFQSKKCHVTFKKQSSYSLWSCNNMKCFCFNFLTNLFL